MNRVIAASTIVVVVALTTAFSAAPGVASPGIPSALTNAIHARFGAGPVNLSSAGLAPAPFAELGYSVSLSADGTTALVGAPGALGGGAAYIFHVSGAASWVSSSAPDAKLTSGSGDPFTATGVSVALSADGTTAFVGDPFSGVPSGAIFVFHAPSADAWTSSSSPAATLNVGHGLFLGNSLAVSPDGTTLVVGAPEYDSGAGGAYVYHVASEGAWATTSTPTAVLSNLAEPANDNGVGADVAISGDGATALLGNQEAGTQQGGAYLFHVANAAAWASSTSPTAILSDSNSPALAFLGYAVALSGDGTTAVLGEPGVNDFAGAVDVFHTADAGAWQSTSTPTATLTDTNGSPNDLLGFRVGVSADGATAIGTALLSTEIGRAYVFHVADQGSWASTSTPTALLSDSAGVDHDGLGVSVSLSGDGTTALLGAPGVNSFVGAAEVFHTADASSWSDTSTPDAMLTDDALLHELCVVPKLKGLTLSAAKSALANAGCRSGKVTNAYSSVTIGRVVTQHPGVGKKFAYGTKVNFVLSLGPFHK